MEGDPVPVRRDLLMRIRGLGTDDISAYIEGVVVRALADADFDRILQELSDDAGPSPEQLNAEAEALWHAG